MIRICAGLVALAATMVWREEPARTGALNPLAEAYVRLVLAVGQHDPDYVDAYYGPEAWKPDPVVKTPLSELRARARTLRDQMRAAPDDRRNELDVLRHQYLARQLESIAARVAMLEGEKLRFDQESRALYDAVAPVHPEAYFEKTLTGLKTLFPGPGAVADDVATFRQQFVIPPGRVDAVFRAAIDACRARTLQHIDLPAGESFTVEYVTGKSWSAYNWYKGGFRSVIQVNTELPIQIDRAIDLACHEGYPGHHVYNVLLEKRLVRDRGWMEYTVYPLFSPQSLIAEGTANFGIEVAFPGSDRVAFERDVLFPLAGLDPATAERYYRVHELIERLDYAHNEAARRYLNGEIDGGAAAAWLTRYALITPERAAQRVRFFDQYRSYVVNYNLGRDMVRQFIERRGGTGLRPTIRWKEFERLISSPRLPSGLQSTSDPQAPRVSSTPRLLTARFLMMCGFSFSVFLAALQLLPTGAIPYRQHWRIEGGRGDVPGPPDVRVGVVGAGHRLGGGPDRAPARPADLQRRAHDVFGPVRARAVSGDAGGTARPVLVGPPDGSRRVHAMGRVIGRFGYAAAFRLAAALSLPYFLLAARRVWRAAARSRTGETPA